MPRGAAEGAGDWCARASTAYFQALSIAGREGPDLDGVGPGGPSVGGSADQQVMDAFAEWYAAARTVLSERDVH